MMKKRSISAAVEYDRKCGNDFVQFRIFVQSDLIKLEITFLLNSMGFEVNCRPGQNEFGGFQGNKQKEKSSVGFL